MIALAATSACRRDRFADGIGRPDQELIESPVLSGVVITEVKPAGLDAFVELLNPTAIAADLTGYVLESPVSSVALSGSIAPGERLTVASATLFPQNTTQSGEVALIAGDGTVQSYLAWGSDPSAAGSTLFVRALQSGAGNTGSVVAVPYPRPLDSAVVRESGFVGCFAPSPAAAPSGAACTVPPATLALREVAPRNSTGVASFVEIANTGAAAAELGGVRICHDGECSPIPAQSLAANAVLVLCLGPVDATSACPLSAPATPPTPARPGVPLVGSTPILGDTETLLAAPGTSFDATAIIDYMRTFGGPRVHTATAIADNLWVETAAPLGTYVRGESLSRNPGALLPPVWNPARATPGEANTVIDRVTNWETCTEPAAAAVDPATPAGAGNLFITIASRVDGTVTLTNIGATNIPDLSVFRISVDDVELQEAGLPLAGPLAANISRTIPVTVNDSGKLEVRTKDASNTLLQFAQWGNPGAGVTAAVEANRWPREDCVLPRLATGESLVARIPGTAASRDRSLLRGSSAFSVQ